MTTGDAGDDNTIEGLKRLVHEVDSPPEGLKETVQKRLELAQAEERAAKEKEAKDKVKDALKDKGKGK